MSMHSGAKELSAEMRISEPSVLPLGERLSLCQLSGLMLSQPARCPSVMGRAASRAGACNVGLAWASPGEGRQKG